MMIFDDNFAGLLILAFMGLMTFSYHLGKFVTEYKYENQQKRGRK
jgi:hypothetical protein